MADRQLSSRREGRSARFAPICRPAITASCRSWPTGRSPAIRACSAWPGPSSPTPTAASTPRCCCAIVRAYQEVQPLTIGELWAVSITLADRADRESAPPRRADRAQPRRAAARRTRSPTACWAPAAATAEPVSARARRARRRALLADAFAVQLVHRLRDQDPQDHAGADLARPAPGRAGHDGRRGRARRAPAAGRRRTSPCATSSPACA